MKTYEVNFDTFAGPTHNYSGLSLGNLASKANQLSVSNPKEAALQSLDKMRFLHSLGFKQGIFPPHPRPHFETLRRLGFHGTIDELVTGAWKECPEVLLAVSSSASMWAANSATVTPSIDSYDGRIQFTPANLSSKFHRSIEVEMTAKLLKRIFVDPLFFKHHSPLPKGEAFSDEGAANHLCFNAHYGLPGVHVFVFGRSGFQTNLPAPHHFPARQTVEASQAIARLHQIPSERVLFIQQNPEAIDAGVFHNDVIAVGNNRVLIYHEKAFCDSDSTLQKLHGIVDMHCGASLIEIKASEKELSLKDAVQSYFFNSQLLSQNDGSMLLIAPSDCQQVPTVMKFIDKVIQDKMNPIEHVHFVNLKESMRNGGGPACLRLRVILNENELQAMNHRFLFTEDLYQTLCKCIQKYYPSEINPRDLGNPKYIENSQIALREIYDIFHIKDFLDQM